MAIYQTYTVKAGDTLSKIAAQFMTDSDTIIRLNRLADGNKISPRQVLKVRQLNETYYVIQPGDTLSKIAENYGVDLGELQRANKLANPSSITAGKRLIIPTATRGAVAASISPTHRLGRLSQKYEVSAGGPGTVSKGVGDFGGVSYGSYQLSSKNNRPAEFLLAEGQPWAHEFEGTVQGTNEFSEIWKQIAEKDLARFDAAQHSYIKRTHYDVQLKTILVKTQLDVSKLSRALQDVVWSVAVQHGPSSKLIVNVINGLKIPRDSAQFEKALITAIYGERGRRNANGALHYFSSSSEDFQSGVARRFVRELKDALDMLAAERSLSLMALSSATNQPADPPHVIPPVVTPKSPRIDSATSALGRAATKLTDDDVRLIVEKYGDLEANSEFLAGNKVLIALRKSTNTRQYRKGVYDDLLLIVQCDVSKSVKVTRFPLNTEPAGGYAFDGTNRGAGTYGPDLNGDGKRELGRLVAGTYHYIRQSGTFMNDVYFKARDIQVTERDVNQDGEFKLGVGGDLLDKDTAGRTMYIHRGGAEGVATWSAGCQTVPKNRYSAFLQAIGGQSKLSYILINAS